MAELIQLKTARYKGVEFLFTDMPTVGGNRLIKFNFPGSDKQAIERQGKVPRTFNMTIVIPHENYDSEKNNLLRVLEDGETGVLTHPTFGDVENVINGQYTLVEKLSELGRAEITVPFEVDDAPGIPQQSGNLPAQVQAESDLLNTQLATDLAGNYEVGLNLSGNFSDALDTVADVAAAFTTAAEFAEASEGQLPSFKQAVTAFAAAAGDLVQAPTALASGVGALFAALNNLYDAPETLFGAFGTLFDFGEDDPPIVPTTVGLTQRKQNRDTMRANMRTQALSYSYLSAAGGTYATTEDLDATQDTLEAQYTDARDNQLLTNAALEQLDRVRVQAQKALDTVRVNTSTIIVINTPLKPLTILVFEFYGDTELVGVIAELNDIKQNAFVAGDVKVLTA